MLQSGHHREFLKPVAITNIQLTKMEHLSHTLLPGEVLSETHWIKECVHNKVANTLTDFFVSFRNNATTYRIGMFFQLLIIYTPTENCNYMRVRPYISP